MKLRQTAVHEAGHVVVGYVLGLACKDVALTHDEVEETGTYGYAAGPNPAYGYDIDSERDRQTILQDESIACCAGLAAEHVIFGVPLDIENENAQQDFQNIINLESLGLRIRGKRDGFVGDETTWRFINRQLNKARKLVKRHRDQIERLADILIEKGKMGGSEVEQLLSKWIRD